MSQLTAIVLLALFSLQVSCFFMHAGAEGGFTVTGQIRLSDGSQPDKCVLELYWADGKPFKSRSVGATFDERLLVAPGLHKYYMKITCANESYTTKRYELGQLEKLDLGVINLTGQPVVQKVPD